MFAEHDDGGLGTEAWRLGVRVLRREFAGLVDLQGSGMPLLEHSPCGFDGDKLRPRGKLAIDVCRHLGLVAGRVQALVALHVMKQAGVVAAAAWAGDARSGFRFEQSIFAVERCLGKVQVEVGLYPRRQVFGGKQVRLLVFPVLAPAVVEGRCLMFLRQAGNQVGMARGDAFLYKRLGHSGNELQQAQPRIDVAGTLAGLLDQRGYVIAGEVQKTLEALRLFIRVHVHTLRVLDQLPFHGLGVREFHDAGGQGKQFRKLRGTEAPRASDDLEAVCVWRTVMGWMRPCCRMLSASPPAWLARRFGGGLVVDSWIVSMARNWMRCCPAWCPPVCCLTVRWWSAHAALYPLRGRGTWG